MNPRYTTFHPKWHRERMPIFWWLTRWNYAKFILRELTSLAVAYAALLLLAEVWSVACCEESYATFLEWLRAPAVLVFHALVLIFLLIHSVTWLNLAPRALDVRLRGRRLPDRMVLGAHYLAWLGASALVAWIVLGR